MMLKCQEYTKRRASECMGEGSRINSVTAVAMKRIRVCKRGLMKM
ncbi:hypothetical protein [Candidatus Sarmatiella mevalonica]|nr:hypothetical protein [Candidatus Sarmatiella mevalonica]